MNTKFRTILAASAAILPLLLAVRCTVSTSGGSGGKPTIYEQFCTKIQQCNLLSSIHVTSYAECLTYAKTVDPTMGNCVLTSANCQATTVCVTDDDDDDSSPEVQPLLTGATLYLGAREFAKDLLTPADAIGDYVGTHERGFVFFSYMRGCHLADGEMYYQLDDGSVVDYESVPSFAPCQSSELGDQIFGYELSEMSGAMTEGQHKLSAYWIDKNSVQTNTYTYHYTVRDTDFTLGATMADFTENDENGDAISLSDYADEVVLIIGFAQWCAYCQAEAGELATAMAAFHTAGNPAAAIGLMSETDTGSSTIPQADLLDWVTTFGWAPSGAGWAIHCLDDGERPEHNPPHPSIQLPYWWENGYPFNMVLDRNHIIRLKWNGYGANLAQDAIQWVLDHPNPPAD